MTEFSIFKIKNYLKYFFSVQLLVAAEGVAK